VLGFTPPPGLFFVALVLMVVAYLLLIEFGKYWFYRSYRASAASAVPRPVPRRHRRVYRRAARFTTGHRLPR
jgi:P-type Mg2+ transporter